MLASPFPDCDGVHITARAGRMLALVMMGSGKREAYRLEPRAATKQTNPRRENNFKSEGEKCSAHFESKDLGRPDASSKFDTRLGSYHNRCVV
jgi:hypothetical protein